MTDPKLSKSITMGKGTKTTQKQTAAVKMRLWNNGTDRSNLEFYF